MTPARNLSVHVDSRDALDVRSFHVEEGMSALFDIAVLAVSENANIDFDAIVGRPARLEVHAGAAARVPVRLWTGVCRDIRQVAVEEAGLSTYHLRLVPSLWLATQRRNHRMFQQKSELDIARALLAEWGIAPEVRVSGVYKKREVRVQYGESDFAFMSRMLEDAGISFHFEQGDAETRLVLTDAPQRGEARPPIAFRDRPTAADQEHVTAVQIGQEVRPGRYTMRDHDPRLPPNYDLRAAAAVGGVEGALEHFHYVPGAFQFGTDQGDTDPFGDDKGKTRTDEREAALLAQKRLAAKRGDAKVCTFETNAADLAPGVVLSVLDHPRADLAAGKQLLVVRSSLRGTASGDWHHRCEARPAEVPCLPPLVTQKPRISGVESATVVGPPGEEIHTDEHGRVRVHFHWDRESKMDDHSSCWIHVSQPWGGAGYGGTNLPRVGQEVLVDFLGGDPDRPVIVGRLYTSLQKTPYRLPENKTQSGWKSSSTQGTGGYNEIMFEDRAGAELVRMQAEKDLRKLVKHDEAVTIGHDRQKLVKNDDALTVGNDRTKVVQNDERVTIGNDRTKLVQRDESVTIGNDRAKLVQHDESVTIGNDRTKLVQNDERVTIGNDRTKLVQNDERVTIGNDRTTHVKSSEHITIGKDLMQTVLASAREMFGLSRNVVVGLSQSRQVGLVDSTMVGQSHVVMVAPPGEQMPAACTSTVMTANALTSKTAGGAKVAMEDKAITLDSEELSKEKAIITLGGKKISADSGGGAEALLDDKAITLDSDTLGKERAVIKLSGTKIEIDSGAGAKIVLDGKTITLTADTLTVKGEATVDIKGKPIKLNID